MNSDPTFDCSLLPHKLLTLKIAVVANKQESNHAEERILLLYDQFSLPQVSPLWKLALILAIKEQGKYHKFCMAGLADRPREPQPLVFICPTLVIKSSYRYETLDNDLELELIIIIFCCKYQSGNLVVTAKDNVIQVRKLEQTLKLYLWRCHVP